LGGGSSEQTVAIARLAAPKGIMTITMTQSNPTVSHDIPKGMGFSFTTSDNLQGAAMAKYAIEKGFKTAYIQRSPDDAYFDMLPVYFGESFEKLGGKVIGEGEFNLGQTEFSVEVAKIKKMKSSPDLIFSAICCGELGAFLKRLRSDGVTTPYWGSDVVDDTSVLGLGSIIEGVVFNSAGAESPDNPAMVEFARRYQKEYGRPLQVAFPALGWEVIHLIEKAVIKAGSIEPMKIRDAYAGLEKEQLPIGTGSTITYAGTDGNPLRSVAICKVKGGKKSFIKWITPAIEDITKPR
jgi:branched-chain amino acid transport system substrate-binding protein